MEAEDRDDPVDLEPLLETTRVINAVIVRALAAVDERLSVPQLRVMVILSDRPRASLSEVADELGLDPSNVSRTCDQLVRRGLVVRETDPEDRRRVALRLSAGGRRLLRRVMERRRALLAGIVGDMDARDQRTLMQVLHRFNESSARVGTTDRGESPSRSAPPWIG